MSAKPIRILIVDDHALVRKGLRALLETKACISVIGEAADGDEAVHRARALRPDVILLDLVMPKKDGIKVIQEIKENDPEARILVLTSFADDDKVFAAIKGGALGYLLKDSKPKDLLKAIRDVHRGHSSLHPSIALKLVREINQPSNDSTLEEPLTAREMSVLKLIAQGLTNQEIANKVTISNRTVTTHVSNILRKLHLANRTQAALFAVREGLVD